MKNLVLEAEQAWDEASSYDGDNETRIQLLRKVVRLMKESGQPLRANIIAVAINDLESHNTESLRDS
jgi:hypothetical protein